MKNLYGFISTTNYNKEIKELRNNLLKGHF